MKIIFTVFVAATFLGIVACSSSDSPSGTMQEFYAHMSEGEVNDAYELVSEDAKKMAEMFGGVSVLADKSEEMSKKGGIKEIKVLEEEINGALAKVKMEITYGNGEEDTRSDKLIREDGKWRLAADK